jgi:hypothetical protein
MNPHLILTPLSLSPSCRLPVPLQQGPHGIQHRGRRLQSHAPLRLLKGEPIAQRRVNEFFLYVLEDLHTSQSLCALEVTSGDPAFVKETVERVYPLIPAFKVYMTRKTQGWFWRWGCPRQSDAATSPGPGAASDGAGSGAGAAMPTRPLLRQHQTTRELQTSSQGGR